MYVHVTLRMCTSYLKTKYLSNRGYVARASQLRYFSAPVSIEGGGGSRALGGCSSSCTVVAYRWEIHGDPGFSSIYRTHTGHDIYMSMMWFLTIRWHWLNSISRRKSLTSPVRVPDLSISGLFVCFRRFRFYHHTALVTTSFHVPFLLISSTLRTDISVLFHQNYGIKRRRAEATINYGGDTVPQKM